MCKDLICVLARHDRYVHYHHRVLEIVENCLHIDKIHSIDECACRLLGGEQTPAGAAALAYTIKAALYNEIGPYITCSIGIAPSRLLAKIASDMQKPDGLTILTQEKLVERLGALRLTDLPGINVRMEARLHRNGVGSIKQFLALSPKQARAVWGSVEGERFWYSLNGYDIPDRITHKSVVGHSRVLDTAHRNPEAAYDMARRLTVKAATRLRRYNLYGGSFSLSARTVDKRYWGADKSFQHTQDNSILLDHKTHDAALFRILLIIFIFTCPHSRVSRHAPACRADDALPRPAIIHFPVNL
jgi:DNA polymerase-4